MEDKPKPTEVSSPCISLCELSEQNICKGCFRSMEDIVAWSGMSNEARRECVTRAAQRRASSRK